MVNNVDKYTYRLHICRRDPIGMQLFHRIVVSANIESVINVKCRFLSSLLSMRLCGMFFKELALSKNLATHKNQKSSAYRWHIVVGTLPAPPPKANNTIILRHRPSLSLHDSQPRQNNELSAIWRLEVSKQEWGGGGYGTSKRTQTAMFYRMRFSKTALRLYTTGGDGSCALPGNSGS